MVVADQAIQVVAIDHLECHLTGAGQGQERL
jgi:hypothetical protein